MRKWFTIIALAAFWISIRTPFEKTDVAKLSPVSALVFERRAGKLWVTSNQGDVGSGDTLEEALEDMELTCPARIFLDTVEYLLIAPYSIEIEELSEYFRPGAYTVCCGRGTDPGAAEAYLRSRDTGVTLRDVQMHEKEMPVLYEIDGRYYLNGEERKSTSAFSVDDGGNIGAAGHCCSEERMDDKCCGGNPCGCDPAGHQ